MSRYQMISETPSAGAAARAEPLVLVPEMMTSPPEPPPAYDAPVAAAAAAPSAAAPTAADGDKMAFEPPPAYEDASNPAKPPSYAEVQQEKAREVVGLPAASAEGGGAEEAARADALHLWRISSVALDPETAAALKDEQLLGTDLMFFTAFLAAFLFNWIGFLLLLCFCHSVAGRYGALAGFGLSLAKWTLIVKNSTTLVSHDNSWLWWLIMAFGLVISVRAMLQYLYIKREWRQLSAAARQRLIFFY